jgi:peptidoglycan hydrolase-like protein with peptidoglycan-binding domain
VCTSYFNRTLPTLRRTSSPPASAETRGIVAHLQRYLNKLGYGAGPVDGWFAARTEAGVRAFQADNGLAVDGVVGPKTWNTWFIVACGFD